MNEVSLREFVDERFNTVEQRFDGIARQLADFEKHMGERRQADQAALQLQAVEYERRLQALNHAHEEARAIQAVTVTRERFDEYAKTEQEKRELALQRVDEKFDDYITRADARVRDVENALAAAATAGEVQARAAEDAARKAKEAAEAAGRRSNRNIAIVGVVLTIIIAGVNFWGTQETSQKIEDVPPVTTTP